ncbi:MULTISPECIES: hypothetical protein [unclassified Bradyrhizobium]|uniref:hypothetical protein n=1 Tax=unclassified Bradyrhizobium TaxID=2631580 RepID=UPI001FF9CE34|nr:MULTISPECIES: hypothetical protein [unclassified Bradyrhizobium]MCK1420194.1 hypothetical protein [Bradyrhizobium sp. CW12]MCK1646823.1 hypothetical protein [Bradyrhizobium sp. 154]
MAVTIAAAEVQIRYGLYQVAVHKNLRVAGCGSSTPPISMVSLGRNGAGRRAEIAAAVLAPSSLTSLLRPLAEYEAVVGGSF